uniref:Uncharacterized protein n=1 Tax=Arundo donax TaxID=35708 RepID=A0A0A9GJ96_ARUDO
METKRITAGNENISRSAQYDIPTLGSSVDAPRVNKHTTFLGQECQHENYLQRQKSR